MHRRILLIVALLLGGAVPVAATAAPVVRTPGYRGTTRPVALQPPTAPPPIDLGAGRQPSILVDDAGTAHIAWNEQPEGAPTVTVYCRIPRNGRACDVTRRLVPPFPDATAINDPRFSVDTAGPEVLALNDQLLILSHRYPFGVPKPGPDRSRDDSTTYLWTSDDGGRSFSNPGVVSTDEIDGDAVTWGTAENPRITTITSLVTGGITAATISPGRFQFRGALLAQGDFTNGRLAVLDGRPVVAYQRLLGSAQVRRWTGQGDPNDAATWSPPEPVPGQDPQIGVAGGRLLLLSESADAGRLELRDLSAGGAPTVQNTGRAGNYSQVIGFPDGAASVVWQGQEDSGATGIWRRGEVRPGVAPRGAPALVIAGFTGFGDASAAPDRGGVVVAELEGKVVAAGFGSRAATGLPGLGSRLGGQPPLAPDTVVDCERIRFGLVEAVLREGGCFLNAARGSAKATTGELRLNGLDIVPDAGVQILIDTRARTIDTTGRVRVLLRAPGVPEITLFRGELHLRLASPRAGASLFSFADGVFRPDVLGFPVTGGVDVRLTDAGVRIPIRLKLPEALGGVSGAIEITADNARGLRVESLDLEASAVPLGPVLLRDLKVQYRASGGTTVGDCLRPPASGASSSPDEWAGVFELELPPPGAGPRLCGSIRFGDGRFRAATFRIDLPYPGITLFPGVSLQSLGGGLSLDPLEVQATVRFGVIPASASGALINLDGSMALRLDPPITLRGQVSVQVATIRVGSGSFTISAAGYVALRLQAGLRFGPFSVQSTIAGFIDGPREQFAISGKAEVCAGECLTGGQVVVSTKGMAVCGPVALVPRGGGVRWDGPASVDVWLISCDADEYEVADTRAQQAIEHAGVAEAPFTVAGRPKSVTVRVRGEGGPPQLDLVGPAGAPVSPAQTYADAATGTTYLGLVAPPAGTWRVRARPGTPPITEVATSRQVDLARVLAARVTGAGERRTLTYRARIGAGQDVTFAERGAAGTRVIGAARRGAGRIAFRPGAGPGGTRSIVALIAQNGLVRREVVVARYRAPAPPRLTPPAGLRVRRAGAVAVATWRPSPAARGQLATIRRGGAAEVRLLGRGARRLVVRGLAPSARLRVEVRSLDAEGRRSAAARAVAAPVRR